MTHNTLKLPSNWYGYCHSPVFPTCRFWCIPINPFARRIDIQLTSLIIGPEGDASDDRVVLRGQRRPGKRDPRGIPAGWRGHLAIAEDINPLHRHGEEAVGAVSKNGACDGGVGREALHGTHGGGVGDGKNQRVFGFGVVTRFGAFHSGRGVEIAVEGIVGGAGGSRIPSGHRGCLGIDLRLSKAGDDHFIGGVELVGRCGVSRCAEGADHARLGGPADTGLDGSIADLSLHEAHSGIGETHGFLTGGEGAGILAVGACGAEEGEDDGG